MEAVTKNDNELHDEVDATTQNRVVGFSAPGYVLVAAEAPE